MRHSILFVVALMLAGCASQSPGPEQLTAAAGSAGFTSGSPSDATAASDAEAPDFVPPPAEALANEQVCEKRKRPGSNIAETYCYTRNALTDSERRDQIDELRREARWRDEIINQAILEGRRPSGFGIGPN